MLTVCSHTGEPVPCLQWPVVSGDSLHQSRNHWSKKARHARRPTCSSNMPKKVALNVEGLCLSTASSSSVHGCHQRASACALPAPPGPGCGPSLGRLGMAVPEQCWPRLAGPPLKVGTTTPGYGKRGGGRGPARSEGRPYSIALRLRNPTPRVAAGRQLRARDTRPFCGALRPATRHRRQA